jgi:hypothetical protein
VRDSGLSGEPAQRFPTRTSTHKLPIRDEPAKPITNRLDRGHGGIVVERLRDDHRGRSRAGRSHACQPRLLDRRLHPTTNGDNAVGQLVASAAQVSAGQAGLLCSQTASFGVTRPPAEGFLLGLLRTCGYRSPAASPWLLLAAAGWSV